MKATAGGRWWPGLRGIPPLLGALCCLGASAAAAAPAPPGGEYGFDWLQPERALCRPISPALRSRLRSCPLEANTFGIGLDARACRVSTHSEVLVYPDKARCQRALETMQANGP